MFRLPMRDATTASPPGALFGPDGKTPGDDLDAGKPGVDYRWEHIVTVFDAQGNLIEDWTQWDKMFRRPHASTSARTTREERLDRRRLPPRDLQVLATTGRSCCRRSASRTCRAPTTSTSIGRRSWPGCPDGTFFVADGYENTRVVKFDKTAST